MKGDDVIIRDEKVPKGKYLNCVVENVFPGDYFRMECVLGEKLPVFWEINVYQNFCFF
jgi:hypothetical protein